MTKPRKKYRGRIVGGLPLSARPILRFSYHTRLMCPDCLLVSSNHDVVKDSIHSNDYHGMVSDCVIHKCKSCGYTDNDGSGFTDSGNYSCYETEDLQKWQAELDGLEDEVASLKYKIARGWARYAELWHTDKDAS